MTSGSTSTDTETMELVEQVLAGRRRAIARALTYVEDGGQRAHIILQHVYPQTGRAHLVGVTGAPGVGKSTVVNALIAEFRRRDKTVAIVAVDPSSPFSGGALLGDRIRMHDHAGDPGVFIRSMASRGSLGGLSRATGDAVSVLDAAGFDYVVIETVGAGQVEVDIAREAHTTVVIEVPGLGDDVQSIKAGLLEIADIFVVNKADQPDAERVVTRLRAMLNMRENDTSFQIPVLKTVATRGEGIAALADAIQAHRAHLEASGEWKRRVERRAEKAFRRILQRTLMNRLLASLPSGRFDAILEQVAARTLDPYTAVHELLHDDPS